MSETRVIPKILLTSGLLWVPSRGMGWHPCKPIDYGRDYFLECARLQHSDIGKTVTAQRAEFVRSFIDPDSACQVIDIGSGAGAFVEYLDCTGYDINRESINWLDANNAFLLPSAHTETPKVLTFWDSFQCIENPAELIIEARPEYIFISVPIFRNAEEAIHSEHFKPGENIWYWTINGLNNFMNAMGFDQIAMNWGEQLLGMDGIASFGFQKSTD